MATEAFEDIAETFAFLDDWEDRYRHVIELGKAMPPLDDSFKVPALKVQGCASQVWLRPMIADGRFDFQGAKVFEIALRKQIELRRGFCAEDWKAEAQQEQQ